jgi:Fe-S-cluster containining protein
MVKGQAILQHRSPQTAVTVGGERETATFALEVPMYTEQRLPVLKRIIDIFDDYAATLDVVCKKGCAVCCTRNVTMTTLEGFRILNHCRENGLQQMRTAVPAAAQAPRFQPQITLNKMAELCANDQDPPVEAVDPAWGPCPFLEDDACSIYPVRPLACRVMVSRSVCAAGNPAEFDDFTLTMSHLFGQYLEHIDLKGLSGNLSDILMAMHATTTTEEYMADGTVAAGRYPLQHNRPVRILMIPPEHRERVQPWLERLNAIEA